MPENEKKISNKFISYLDKHRIYELFYDVATLLIVNQPNDCVHYLRNLFAEMNRHCVKVILIAPPHVDKRKVATAISKFRHCRLISLDNFRIQTDHEYPENFANSLSESLYKYIEENNLNRYGWILYDYPKTKEEAESMILNKILPTHTFQLVPSMRKFSKTDIWNENIQSWNAKKLAEAIKDYKFHMLDIRRLFQSTLKEIVITGRTFIEITNEIIKLLKKMPNKNIPFIPRIVLFGPNESQLNILAKIISCKFNIKFIDMNDIVNSGLRMNNEIGEQLRFLEKRRIPFYGKLILKLLENRLCQIDCLNGGWILINFPRDRTDMEELDDFDVTPNKVILLASSFKNCYDKFTKVGDNDYKNFTNSNEHRISSRGKNNIDKIDNSENELFKKTLTDLLEYCGSNCYLIDCNGTLEEEYEKIEHYIRERTVTEPRPGKSLNRRNESDESIEDFNFCTRQDCKETCEDLYFDKNTFQISTLEISEDD